MVAPDKGYSQTGLRRVIYCRRPPAPFAEFQRDEYLLPEEEIGPLAWALFTAPEKVAQFAPYRQPASQVRDFLVCVDGIIDCSNPQPLTVAPAALTPMPLAVKLNCPPTPSALSPTTSPRT